MYLFSVYYVWVCSRGTFPSRQNTDLAAIICLPCFSNSNSARLSCCCRNSLRIPRKGPFYLIPAPPEVVRCAVFIDLCGRSAFLNPATSQEAFTYHHASFVCIFHFFQSLSLGTEQGKAIAPAFHLSPTGLNKIRVSSFMFSAQSVISTRGLN